jgi:hypothetical protein
MRQCTGWSAVGNRCQPLPTVGKLDCSLSIENAVQRIDVHSVYSNITSITPSNNQRATVLTDSNYTTVQELCLRKSASRCYYTQSHTIILT